MPLGGYRGAGGTGRVVSRKQHKNMWVCLDLKVDRVSQFNTAGGSEFQVRGAAVLNDRLANDVRRNGTRSSGTDDDRVLRALVRNEVWLGLGFG